MIASGASLLVGCTEMTPGLVTSTEFVGTSDHPNELDRATGTVEADFSPSSTDTTVANVQFNDAVISALRELQCTVESRDGGSFVAVSPQGQRVQLTADPTRTYSGVRSSLKVAIFSPGDGVVYGEVPDLYWESVRDLYAAISFHLHPTSEWDRTRYQQRVASLNTRLNAARAASIGATHHAMPKMPKMPRMPH